MSSSSSAASIRVTTYNVLSSQLARADYFSFCNPKWLQASYRLTKIKEKMDAEVARKSIICLQEVSTAWAGNLHTYFAARGYHLITGLYGGKFNGYMGVALAVPLSEYDILDADVTRVADTKKVTRAPKESGLLHALKNIFYWPALRMLKALGWYEPPKSAWDEALNKFNQMVVVRLRPKQAQQQAAPSASADESDTASSFVVGTYHMPCVFRIPQVNPRHLPSL